MSRAARRLTLLMACAAVLGPVAIAQASDASLRAAVKSSIPKITKSQAKILDGLATYQKTHNATALVSAIKAQDTALKALEAKLSGQAPSSANGTKAKADIMKGLGLIVSSNTTLAQDIEKASKHKTVSKSQLNAASSADKQGNLDVSAGTKLLKV